MLKLNYQKFLALGLVIFLSACSSAETNQSAPVKEAAPVEAVTVPDVKAEESQAEAAGPESSMAEQAVTVEEVEAPVAAVEKVTPIVAEESMAEVEETAPIVEEPTALAEATPLEEEVMKEAAKVTKAGPTEAQAQLLASLDSKATAPELFNEVWLNSNPLKLEGLRGKVVLIEFWTFG